MDSTVLRATSDASSVCSDAIAASNISLLISFWHWALFSLHTLSPGLILSTWRKSDSAFLYLVSAR